MIIYANEEEELVNEEPPKRPLEPEFADEGTGREDDDKSESSENSEDSQVADLTSVSSSAPLQANLLVIPSSRSNPHQDRYLRNLDHHLHQHHHPDHPETPLNPILN